MTAPLRKLTPEEELQYLGEIHGEKNYDRIFALITESYNVLQTRAQLLLSLVTICLTIAGFSGPTIAASGFFPKLSLGLGLALVMISALITLVGPLQLRWSTQWRAGSVEDSLVLLIRRRNSRAAKYHLALVFLIFGLGGYVTGTVWYLLRL